MSGPVDLGEPRAAATVTPSRAIRSAGYRHCEVTRLTLSAASKEGADSRFRSLGSDPFPPTGNRAPFVRFE